MPCKSPEAIQRKAQRKKERRQAAKPKIKLQTSDLPQYKIAARHMLPRLPEMSKAELRDMLAQAFSNTAK